VLITHDLGAVTNIADVVMVLYAGRKVEIGDAKELLMSPRHPYTKALIESTPGSGRPHKSRLAALPGPPLSPFEVDAEQACPFRTRCQRAIEVCAERFPEPSVEGEHVWYCHNPETPL
jgi:oligopeptide/dipeptide ABC transporter ATP-binding protein